MIANPWASVNKPKNHFHGLAWVNSKGDRIRIILSVHRMSMAYFHAKSIIINGSTGQSYLKNIAEGPRFCGGFAPTRRGQSPPGSPCAFGILSNGNRPPPEGEGKKPSKTIRGSFRPSPSRGRTERLPLRSFVDCPTLWCGGTQSPSVGDALSIW